MPLPAAPGPDPAAGPLTRLPHLQGWELIGAGAMLISTICMLVATFITWRHIVLHLRNYTRPDTQRVIIRILVMVPVYAMTCWLSLILPTTSVIVESIRGVYEAFVYPLPVLSSLQSEN